MTDARRGVGGLDETGQMWGGGGAGWRLNADGDLKSDLGDSVQSSTCTYANKPPAMHPPPPPPRPLPSWELYILEPEDISCVSVHVSDTLL